MDYNDDWNEEYQPTKFDKFIFDILPMTVFFLIAAALWWGIISGLLG